jgi:hypothetical protein
MEWSYPKFVQDIRHERPPNNTGESVRASKAPVKCGTKVEVTVRGTVKHVRADEKDNPRYRIVDSDGTANWVTVADPIAQNLLIVAPAHVPVRAGQVWATGTNDDVWWFVRISRPDISPRFTPSDLSDKKGLGTISEEQFFERYPHAILKYSPALDLEWAKATIYKTYAT